MGPPVARNVGPVLDCRRTAQRPMLTKQTDDPFDAHPGGLDAGANGDILVIVLVSCV